ncbi:SixA phosphatase family protein [Jiella sonneratiae]|uniref:Histidine phosphatase family protein n=1 Tax=Jiella sonneratiae TaxID=2816856 RepID=A0ABS3IXJ0_9HYPH|nr:histidine phosphatase family protein [Jiella sonneratiae]MBO0902109.1 histidine phosphatase family protein [Jiella sonneratiae]
MTASFGHHLYILRHAHSSWARPGERDHQRPLDERGARDADRLAEILGEESVKIDAVACSTARRAVDTLTPLRAALGNDVAIDYSDDLYALGAEAYFAAAARAPANVSALLIVGHNPMVEEFTAQLAGDGDEAARAALAGGFPTCALAIVGLPRPLAEVAPGSGRLLRVVRP